MLSRLEKVKNCFQNMDLNGLKKLLIHEDKLLQARHKVFFEAIGDLFKTLKNKGNDSLLLYSAIGYDFSNNQKPAIQFIGNSAFDIIDKKILGDYFELIIYEAEEVITFEIGKTIIPDHGLMREGKLFKLFIDEVDKLPQFQNKELIADYEEGSQAIKELNQLKVEVRELSEYVNWIEKYNSLFERNLFYDKKGITSFHKFFRTFLRIRKLKYLNYEMYKFVAKKGYLEFLELDTTKKEEMIPWLCRYERVPIWLIPYYNKSIETTLKKEYFEFEGCKIKIDDLGEILKFIHYFTIYKDHYEKEFHQMRFDYQFQLYDSYHHPKYVGFFELVSKKLGIPTKPIKIRNGEDPIESHHHLWAFFR